MALKDLKVKIGADTSGFNRGMKDVKSGLSGLKGTTTGATSAMSSGMGSFVKKIGLAALAIKGLQMAIRAAGKAFTEFLAFESSMRRTAEIFGDANKYVTYFAENTAKSLGMAEAAAYKYAAVYGNLFKGITKDSAENSKVTIAMLKASAVVASKTGLDMETVMTKIRSGILGSTEAIDDLGIEVKIGMLVMTDAFKKISNGRSWEQLNFHEQEQIRVLGILEQAHKQYGDTVMKGSVFSLNTLKGAFKDLTVYAGSFINAALQPIIKGLTQLVYWALAGMKALAGLFGLKVNTDMGVQNAVAEAGAQEDLNEELKKTAKAKQKLAGFDQINTLPSDSGGAGKGGKSSGSGASVFDGIAMPEFEMDTSKIDGKLSNLKKSLEGFANKVKEVWNTLYKNTIQPIVETFSPIMAGLVDKAKSKWADLKKEFKDTKVWTDLMTIWNTMTKVWGFWGTLVVKVWGVVANLGMDVFFLVLKGALTQLESAIGLVAAILRGDFSGAWGHFKDLMINNPIHFVTEAFGLLREKGAEAWEWIKLKWAPAGQWIKDKVTTPIGDFFKGAGQSIKDTFSSIDSWFRNKFTQAWQAIKGVFSGVGDFFGGIWNTIKSKFTTIGSSVGNAMGDAFKYVVNSIIGFAEKTINGFIRAINSAIGLINKIPGVNIGLLQPMNIPKLERGGIVSSPTLAMVGESGKEAVMPLENNTGWIDKLAAKINSAGGGGDISLYADIYLDNGTLIDTVVRKIKRENVRSGKMVREG